MEPAISKAIAIRKQSISRSVIRYIIAINKAIEVVIGDQVCDRDQFDVEHIMWHAINKAIETRR